MNWQDDFEQQLQQFLEKYFQMKNNFDNIIGGG